MFHRIQQYGLLYAGGVSYLPRAYGAVQADGTWEGRLVFFPIRSGTAVTPPGPETTQTTRAAVATWAAGLTTVYLEGALARALAGVEQPPPIAQLTAAEYEALDDAARLATAAAAERTAADLDDAAAEVARAEARQIRRERLATEGALAATKEAAASIEAERHEAAARDARAVAAAASRRRRSALAEADSPEPSKRRSGKKSERK
jgi:hypothetical protein